MCRDGVFVAAAAAAGVVVVVVHAAFDVLLAVAVLPQSWTPCLYVSFV